MFAFLHRHKWKLLGATVLGVGAGIYFGSDRLAEEAQNFAVRMIEEKQLEERRNKQFQVARKESEATAMRFLPILRKTLFKLVNVEDLIAGLKDASLPQASRITLWEHVKVLALTRLFTGLYAFNLMTIVLHIQLHILGRRAFEKTAKKANNSTEQLAAEKDGDSDHGVRHKFLTVALDYLLNDGLEKLIAHVKQAVVSSTTDWSVTTKMQVKAGDIAELISAVRGAVEADPEGGCAPLMQFVYWPQDDARAQGDVLQLLNETRDMIESPNFLEAFEDSMEDAFEQLNIHLCQCIYSTSSTAVVKQSSKVIPQLNKVTKNRLLLGDSSTDKNEYLAIFVELQSATAFYEAVFMQQD